MGLFSAYAQLRLLLGYSSTLVRVPPAMTAFINQAHYA